MDSQVTRHVCTFSTISVSSVVARWFFSALTKINLTSPELLSHRTLNKRLNELKKQEQRKSEELTSKNERLEKELKTAKKTMATFEGAVRGERTS